MNALILLVICLPFSSAQTLVYPSCVKFNTLIRKKGQAVQIRVSEVADLGAIAAGCAPEGCENTDKFEVGSADICAKVCLRVHECNFWSYGFEEGLTLCWLRSGRIGEENVEGYASGAKGCSPPLWPDCVERETVIRNAGKAVFFDATAFGSDPIDGCYNGDCAYTDKFLTGNAEACGYVCSKVASCKWWTLGVEDNLQKCWLRSEDDGRERNAMFISGSRSCGAVAPVDAPQWTQGDNQCWGGGFTSDMCCDQRYGSRGNPNCWDATHTFEMCCLGHPPKGKQEL